MVAHYLKEVVVKLQNLTVDILWNYIWLSIPAAIGCMSYMNNELYELPQNIGC